MRHGLSNGGNSLKGAHLQYIELKNEIGFRVGLLDYGATIQSIYVPANDGDLNVVLAYPDPADYACDAYYLGSTLGRYAGRIGHGRLALSGRRYQLATGDNIHCLHGGPEGFSSRLWNADLDTASNIATFRYESPDGEQGFPGGLVASVRYSLHGDSGLLIEYLATSDAETVVNLSNHAYFNLNGKASDITDHRVLINADHYAVADEGGIPCGELRDVSGSRFDFRQSTLLRDRVNEEGMGADFGYDHAFALNRSHEGLSLAAAAWAPATGLWLKVSTTQPALQFYTGEYLGAPLMQRAGFCFEAQNFPDAPNIPGFPTSVLKPGEEYRQTILYEFGCDAGFRI